jgi:methylmalonyl-CoA/ethylmalonyl-CoA epimerase
LADRHRSPSGPHVAHIGVAVKSLAEALPFYRDVLGLVPHQPETVDGATIVALSAGPVDIELLEPVTPDSPVARFLAKRGPGIHHLCFQVPDLERALEECRRRGYRAVDDEPRTGVGGRRIAFLSPKSTAGILIELTE